jgi:hypothetical protein
MIYRDEINQIKSNQTHPGNTQVWFREYGDNPVVMAWQLN